MKLELLYERQSRRVYRIAMLYLKNPSDAEDTVQNIFLKYMEKQIVFENPEHEKAWFITVTRNHCKDVLKSVWHRKVDYTRIPEQKSADGKSSELLCSVMSLPPKFREVLYLYYYEDYSVKELSKMLNRKESTIQTRLASAREKLKQLIEQEEKSHDRSGTKSCI